MKEVQRNYWVVFIDVSVNSSLFMPKIQQKITDTFIIVTKFNITIDS